MYHSYFWFHGLKYERTQVLLVHKSTIIHRSWCYFAWCGDILIQILISLKYHLWFFYLQIFLFSHISCQRDIWRSKTTTQNLKFISNTILYIIVEVMYCVFMSGGFDVVSPGLHMMCLKYRAVIKWSLLEQNVQLGLNVSVGLQGFIFRARLPPTGCVRYCSSLCLHAHASLSVFLMFNLWWTFVNIRLMLRSDRSFVLMKKLSCDVSSGVCLFVAVGRRVSGALRGGNVERYGGILKCFWWCCCFIKMNCLSACFNKAEQCTFMAVKIL